MFYISPDIFVKLGSPKGGLGVFAKNNIPKNTLLELSPFSSCWKSTWASTPYHLKKTVFSFPQDTDNYVIGLGYTSVYNHDDNNNAHWYSFDFGIGIFSIKEILSGQEIFINYGPNYWKNGWDKI